MKNSILTKLLAFVLAVVMVLGTCASALAEISYQDYEAAVKMAAELFSQEVLDTQLLDELKSLTQQMSEDQFVRFKQQLQQESETAVAEKVEELILLQVELDTDKYIPPVNFARAAGFGAPAVGTAPVMRTMLLADAQEQDDGLKIAKNVSVVDEEKGEYKLTLEAWATGAKVITEVSEEIPTDIILVLDQSGSMNFCMYGECNNQYCDGKHNVRVYTETYNIHNNGDYYIKTDNGYSKAYYCDGGSGYFCSAGWYDREHGLGNHRGTKLTPKTDASDAEGTQFYTQTTEQQTFDKRITALRTGVTSFVDSVKEKAAGEDKNLATTADNIDHRIAIVGFASEDSDTNTEILTVAGTNSGTAPNRVGVGYSNLNTTHYSSALQDVSTAAGQTMVDKAVTALDANGATAVDYGLTMADKILANNPVPANEKRNRVVIVFTDGSPTYSSSFQESVANGAIKQAESIKNDRNATVYSIGIFNGADGSNPGTLPANNNTGSNRENRFMHLISSNYPDATSLTSTGSLNSKLSSGRSYFLSAGDTSTLANIFQTIASEIESGGSTATLDESAVIKDVLTDQFVLPEGADKDDIKVYTADYTAANTFATPVEYAAATVDISTDGKTISVTNFDYAENWVGTETAADGTVSYRGKKLIIEIPIVVRGGFLGGNSVLTNAAGSGVYENSSSEKPIEEFVSPDVDIQIDEVVTVAVPDTNVYLLDDVSASQLEPILDIRIGDVKLDMTKENYGLADWQKAYVAIDDNEVLDGFTDLTEDKTYSVTVKVKPTTTGKATGKEGTATGNIKVFKPVLTFADSVENYLSTPSCTDDYYNKTNYMGVVWEYGEGEDKKVSTDSDITMATTTPPTLDLTYTPAQDTWIDSSNKVVSTADIPVNVSATIGGVNVDQYTKAIRKACTTCDFKKTEATEITTLAPEFIVHIKNVYGELKIIKKGLRKGESAVFTVNGTVADGTANGTAKKWTVVLTATDDNADPTATITGLLVGSTYTVTEDPNWTWTYIEGDEPNKLPNTILALNAEGAPATVTITNTESDKWLHDESSVKNVFNKVNPNN